MWLSRDVPAIVAVNLTIIWKTSSFVALILLAGLQSIDKNLYEAATVDGANAWQRFWRITLPLLRPAIAVALIFRTLTAIQTFDIPYAMTNGWSRPHARDARPVHLQHRQRVQHRLRRGAVGGPVRDEFRDHALLHALDLHERLTAAPGCRRSW
ncbi:MAG: sugar ABC transporter permease [Trueperaceae bacterium]|nr:sugar ABC transporter permease [Trueperaceae bacterium]